MADTDAMLMKLNAGLSVAMSDITSFNVSVDIAGSLPVSRQKIMIREFVYGRLRPSKSSGLGNTSTYDPSYMDGLRTEFFEELVRNWNNGINDKIDTPFARVADRSKTRYRSKYTFNPDQTKRSVDWVSEEADWVADPNGYTGLEIYNVWAPRHIKVTIVECTAAGLSPFNPAGIVEDAEYERVFSVNQTAGVDTAAFSDFKIQPLRTVGDNTSATMAVFTLLGDLLAKGAEAAGALIGAEEAGLAADTIMDATGAPEFLATSIATWIINAAKSTIRYYGNKVSTYAKDMQTRAIDGVVIKGAGSWHMPSSSSGQEYTVCVPVSEESMTDTENVGISGPTYTDTSDWILERMDTTRVNSETVFNRESNVYEYFALKKLFLGTTSTHLDGSAIAQSINGVVDVASADAGGSNVICVKIGSNYIPLVGKKTTPDRWERYSWTGAAWDY